MKPLKDASCRKCLRRPTASENGLKLNPTQILLIENGFKDAEHANRPDKWGCWNTGADEKPDRFRCVSTATNVLACQPSFNHRSNQP